MKEAITRLLNHMHWADAQTLAALRAVTPPAEALKWYAHVVAVERTWCLRMANEDWKTQPEEVPLAHGGVPWSIWPNMTLDECAALAARNEAQVKGIVARLTDDELARRATYVNSAGKTFTNSVADMLIHMALHGVHHRGQIAASLRRAGTAPPDLDYISFVRDIEETR